MLIKARLVSPTQCAWASQSGLSSTQRRWRSKIGAGATFRHLRVGIGPRCGSAVRQGSDSHSVLLVKFKPRWCCGNC